MRDQPSLRLNTRVLLLAIAGLLSLPAVIQVDDPVKQQPRQTPTLPIRILPTATYTRPPRWTDTPVPRIVQPTETHIPPTASTTPTVTVKLEALPSNTPTPTYTATPTPADPAEKLSKDPIDQESIFFAIVVIAVTILITSVVLATVTFGAGAALVILAVIAAGALIGGVISQANGGNFMDGILMGMTVAAIPVLFTSVASNIWRGLKKKKRDD